MKIVVGSFYSALRQLLSRIYGDDNHNDDDFCRWNLCVVKIAAMQYIKKIITITFRELSEGIDYWLIILFWDSFRISHGIAIQTVSTFHTRMDENHRIIVSWLWLENRARLDLEKFRTALDSSAAMSPGETRHFLFTLISARFDSRVVKTISFHSLMSFCTLIREIDWSKLHFHLKLDPIVKSLSNFFLSSFSCDITMWLGGVVFLSTLFVVKLIVSIYKSHRRGLQWWKEWTFTSS